MKTKKEINEMIEHLDNTKLSIEMFLDSLPMGEENKKLVDHALNSASLKKKENLTQTEIMFVKHELQGMLAALRWVKK